MKLISLISSYKEGPLIQAAIRSALVPGISRVVVFEGAAGPPLDGCSETDLGDYSYTVDYHEGTWSTDAAKRTAIVKYAQQFGSPLWGVWIDGDEALINGEYLRDHVQRLEWQSEIDAEPYVGMPLRLVEMDGSVSVASGRVLRLDLISNYVVSIGGIKFKGGHTESHGNLPQSIREWRGPRTEAVLRDHLYLDPPLPGEPFLLHRSPLRHPERAKLRMHEQETRELERLRALAE